MEPDNGIKIISCRICRESADSKVTFELNSKWSSLFQFCFGFQVSDNGPLSFCENCSEKLKDYGAFKHLCLQSEEIWKSMTNMPSFDSHKLYEVKEEIVDYKNFEHDDNAKEDEFDGDNINYDLIWVVKEDKQENVTSLVKKLEDDLTEISIKKIENPLTENKTPLEIKCQNIKRKNGKKTKCCKYGEKGGKKQCKTSKNNFNGTVKKEATKLYCGLCDFTSVSSLDINQHVLQHCQDNISECSLCSFEGKDVAHMISHRYTHCAKTGKRYHSYECPMCSEKFKSDYQFQYHYRTVHLKTKGGLCIYCGQAFRTLKNWKRHERAHVSKNYICDHCDRSFLHRSLIEDHMRSHYNIFYFICDVCGKGFKKLWNLKNHTYLHHQKEQKQVMCTVCSRKYKNKEVLKHHMRSEHSQKKYLCEACSESFCTKTQLGHHFYYYHTDEKPYACDLCSARYRSNMHLKIHKRKHTGELPYRCQECGREFSSLGSCKRHQSVHTGVRPVKCLYCSKTFHTKKLMHMHCNSKHKNSGVDFSNCE